LVLSQKFHQVFTGPLVVGFMGLITLWIQILITNCSSNWGFTFWKNRIGYIERVDVAGGGRWVRTEEREQSEDSVGKIKSSVESLW
jgi:hypothetical protein